MPTLDEKPVSIRVRHLVAATIAIIGATAAGTWRTQAVLMEVSNKLSNLSGRVTGLERSQEQTTSFVLRVQQANIWRGSRETQRKELCANSKLNLPPWACFGLLSEDELASLRGQP